MLPALPIRLRTLMWVVVAFAAGCGSPTPPPPAYDSGLSPLCTLGTTQPCTCAGGVASVRTCGASGTYGECDCAAQSDAGTICTGTLSEYCVGGCTDLATDPNNCGACGVVCPRATGCLAGTCACPGSRPAVCEGVCADLASDSMNCGACGNVCPPGDICQMGACVTASPLRPITPQSTARVTSQSPMLRWVSATGVGAHVEVCADPACTHLEESADVSGTSCRLTTTLHPGAHFWRLRAAGDTVFTPTWEFWVGARNGSIDAFSGLTLDMNRDGYADLVASYGVPSSLYVYLGGPSVASTTPVGIPVPSVDDDVGAAMAGDVNGDGFADLFAILTAPGSIDVYLVFGAAGGFGEVSIVGGLGLGYVPTALGDVNGDGFADLLGILESRATYGAVWLPGGPSGFGTVVNSVCSAAVCPTYRPAGDVNGDGYDDVATAGVGSGAILFGSAAGLAATPISLPAPVGASGYFTSLLRRHNSEGGTTEGCSLPARVDG